MTTSPSGAEIETAPALPAPIVARRRAHRAASSVFLLYTATVLVDPIRKTINPTQILLVTIYVCAIVAYIRQYHPTRRFRLIPGSSVLVVGVLMTVWCILVAVVDAIPLRTAAIGWSSYVLFVPLIFTGFDFASDEHTVRRGLRVLCTCSAIIGFGALLGLMLRHAAPAVLRPIIPAVGIHTAANGSMYLAPSFFADGEQAAESLLFGLFAWLALASDNSTRYRKIHLVSGILIVLGLFATNRRADISVGLIGALSFVLIGRSRYVRLRTSAPNRKSRRLAVPIAISASAIVALLLAVGAKQQIAFLASGSEGADAIHLMFSPVNPGSMVGEGPGTSTQGAIPASPSQQPGSAPTARYSIGDRSFRTAEGGLTKAWLELGVTGAVLYGSLFAVLLAPLLRGLRNLDSIGRAATCLVFALCIIFLKGHASLDDPLIQPLYWVAVGVCWARRRASMHAHELTHASLVQVSA